MQAGYPDRRAIIEPTFPIPERQVAHFAAA